MAIQERSKLRGTIRGRTPETAPDGSLRLRLELDGPLPGPVRAALGEEIAQLTAHPIEGLVAPRALEVGPQHLVLTLDAIHPGALRLSDLLAGLRASGAPLDDGLAAALTATAAQLTHKIHLAPGLRGHARLHGAPHPGTLILTPAGTVALIGTGLPHVDALLAAPDVGAEARHTSPEVAAGRFDDPRSDVYGLGVLYLSLLSGQTPWSEVAPEAHLRDLAAGRLSNPQVTIQNPRAALVELLRRAMAPSITSRYPTALAFGQAISNELKASGRPRGDARALERLIEGAVPAGAPRGPGILAPHAGPRPVTVPKDTPTRPAPPSQDAWVEASRPPGAAGADRGWSQVLGEAPPPDAPPGPSAPAEPAPPPAQPVGRIALPVPDAPADPAPSAKLWLPPSGPQPGAAGPTGPTAPALPAASPIDALYDDDVPSADGARGAGKAPPRVSLDGEEGSMKGTLLIGAGLLAAVGAIWLLTRGDDPEVEDPGPAVVVAPATPDAGLRPAGPPDAGVRAASPPDAGALKPLGFLMVFSTPSGATVELNGGYVGKTPLVLKHDFEPRDYEITVLADGYKKWTKTMRPDRDKKSINVKAILEKR